MVIRASALGILVLVSLVLGGACSEARIVEDGAAACSNKKDDDGDGLIDCDDPDCFPTDACERTAAACSNDTDDDRNGLIDCQQDSCKLLPQCKDAIETDCTISARETGCPRGKGCYVTPDNRRWCAPEGASLAGGACGNTDPIDRSRGCAAGYLCVTGDRCARVCLRDSDCTRNSVCRPFSDDISLCTLSCITDVDCRPDEECVALQRTSLRLEAGGWAHQCVARRAAPPAGTVLAGESCFDGDSERPLDELCAPGLLCIREPTGNRCRSVCRGRSDGHPSGTCAAGFLCYPVVPFSAQESRFDEPDVIGVCLP
jgi:hypothetical protein